MSNYITLADYLFTRLKQLGVGAIHGVPGDYNLDLLDHIEPLGLLWVGNVNELNAGYAADGYARTKGIGAIVTTFGVGELSAINAIAGAYAERAAVVHIVGTPPRASQDGRLNIHHTLGDGEYRHFSRMSAHVTVAQVNLLDCRTTAAEIDMALEQCLLHSRPVYIEIPTDMVKSQVLASRLANQISVSTFQRNSSHEAAVDKILERCYAAKQPVILVDGESRALGLADCVQEWIIKTKWPTFTTGFGKDLVDLSLPNVYGIYRGTYADPRIKTFVEASDLVLCFGPHFSSTNSYGWSAVPAEDRTISFTFGGVKAGKELLRDLSVKEVAIEALQKLDLSKIEAHQSLDLPQNALLPPPNVIDTDIIKHDSVWRILSAFMRPGDIVFGETGTAGYGVREMAVPKHTRVFTPTTWLSIGYMLPACQGAALAQRELIAEDKYHGMQTARTILFIGDGSFQMTAQEIATMIRYKLNVIIFVINNYGYTIERCIHGRQEKYNDVPCWKYLDSIEYFGGSSKAFKASARTYGELRTICGQEELADGEGLRMVEIFMDKEDAPEGPLLNLLNLQRKAGD